MADANLADELPGDLNEYTRQQVFYQPTISSSPRKDLVFCSALRLVPLQEVQEIPIQGTARPDLFGDSESDEEPLVALPEQVTASGMSFGMLQLLVPLC